MGNMEREGIDLPLTPRDECERPVEADALGINPLEDASTRLNDKLVNTWRSGSQLRRSP